MLQDEWLHIYREKLGKANITNTSVTRLDPLAMYLKVWDIVVDLDF